MQLVGEFQDKEIHFFFNRTKYGRAIKERVRKGRLNWPFFQKKLKIGVSVPRAAGRMSFLDSPRSNT